MTFIENIYTELKNNAITKNSEEFSTRFLRKSPHYYSAIKSQGREAHTSLLLDLAENLVTQREALQAYDKSGLLESRWKKWSEIEEKVAQEVALRTTRRGKLHSGALNSVIFALQTVSNNHAVA